LPAGSSSISIAKSEEQMFPSNLLNCLKWLQKLYSCFVAVVVRSFSQSFPLGAPVFSAFGCLSQLL